MSNEEFDNLMEELMWEGSSVVMLSTDEQQFLEASISYVSCNPIMSDKECDQLMMQLKKDGSDIVAEGPRCSLRSRKVYSDLTVDYLKMFLINVPAAVVALVLYFFLDDVTGFKITYLLEVGKKLKTGLKTTKPNLTERCNGSKRIGSIKARDAFDTIETLIHLLLSLFQTQSQPEDTPASKPGPRDTSFQCLIK